MSSTDTLRVPTGNTDAATDDETTMEGWRRLARIMAGFLLDAAAEPAGDADCAAGKPGE